MDMLEKFNFIHKVGLEIEGCWPKPRKDLIEDGSMRANEFRVPYGIDNLGNKVALFGELLSQPLDSPKAVFEFLKENWVSETGRRCGFHIHVSLRDLDAYCACMSRDFYDKFLAYITAWATEHCDNHRVLWERLCNHNEYCADVFIPDVQAAITKKTVVDRRRYCILNYCWGMHKTIECRLFPTFLEVETALSATNALMSFFESYLQEHLPKRRPLVLVDDCDEELPTNKQFVLPRFNLFVAQHALSRSQMNRFSANSLAEKVDKARPWEKPRKIKTIPPEIMQKIEQKEIAEHAAALNRKGEVHRNITSVRAQTTLDSVPPLTNETLSIATDPIILNAPPQPCATNSGYGYVDNSDPTAAIPAFEFGTQAPSVWGANKPLSSYVAGDAPVFAIDSYSDIIAKKARLKKKPVTKTKTEPDF